MKFDLPVTLVSISDIHKIGQILGVDKWWLASELYVFYSYMA